MPPYPMMPFAVEAILQLREEASAKFAKLRARLARRTTPRVPVAEERQDEARPIPMPQRSVRRAA